MTNVLDQARAIVAAHSVTLAIVSKVSAGLNLPALITQNPKACPNCGGTNCAFFFKKGQRH